MQHIKHQQDKAMTQQLSDDNIKDTIDGIKESLKERVAAMGDIQPGTKHMFNTVSEMSSNEMMNLSFHLQKYHAVFNKFFQIGTPIFDPSVPTAAVYTERETGRFLYMRIGPEFWKSITLIEKLFVIVHECTHLILNHPIRMMNYENQKVANIAMDLVVNHTAVEKFGFKRREIDPNDVYCWIDKFFLPDEDIRTNETVEYYYPLLMDKLENGQMPSGWQLVDSHESMSPEDFERFIRELDRSLTPQEKEALRSLIKKHGVPGQADGAEAGIGGETFWTFFDFKVKKKKKWETVIKKWALKHAGHKEKVVDQWARIARRFALLQGELSLPSAMEYDAPKMEKSKIKVHFYLDTSGSCHHLADRFFKAAKSLPDDKFEIRLFCFHDYVTETDIAEGKVQMGGGTNFGIIENNIQTIKKSEESGKYPHVFVVTDGMGTAFTAEMPEKWHWFLSANYTDLIPKESKIYMLDDFE